MRSPISSRRYHCGAQGVAHGVAFIRQILHRSSTKGANRMSVEENKALVRRFWEEVFNKRNLVVADELLAPDAINYEAPPGMTREGPESVKQVLHMLTAAFPDHHT